MRKTESPAVKIVGEGIAFGEGPVWDTSGGTVVCVSVADGALYRVWPGEGRAERLAVTEGGPNACAPSRSGGFLVTQNGGIDFSQFQLPGLQQSRVPSPAPPGIQYVDADGTVSYLATEVAGADALRGPNDLVTTRTGEVYFTDPGHHPLPAIPGGRVLRMERSGLVSVVAGGFEYCNGIALDLSDELLVIEAQGLLRLDLSGRREWLVRDFGAAGDGMAVDVLGHVYVCIPGQSCVCVVNPAGEIERRLEMPEGSCPTNCCFGGSDGRTLFVTLSLLGSIGSIEGLPHPGREVYLWPN